MDLYFNHRLQYSTIETYKLILYCIALNNTLCTCIFLYRCVNLSNNLVRNIILNQLSKYPI